MKKIIFALFLMFFYQGFGQTKAAYESLVKVEKEFSDYCVIQGAPQAWIKYFAPDGIMFTPQPVNAIEFMKPRLINKRPREFLIKWEAFFTDVSQAEDLGYNIGPSVKESIKYDTVPNQYGYVFSIWKKVDDTTWRVALDAGAGVKEKNSDHEFNGKFITPKSTVPGKLKGTFLEVEKRFNSETYNRGLFAAYKKFITDESLMLRDEWPLMKNKKEILHWMSLKEKSESEKKTELKILGSGSSRSNDLAYVYGSYTKTISKEDGIFIHIWKRINGKWYLIFDRTGGPPKKN